MLSALRASSILLSAFSVGCHATKSLELPPLSPTTQSLLMLGAVEGEILFARAVKLSEPGGPSLPAFSNDAEFDLYAVEYSCSVASVGFSPGPIKLRETLAERLELPPPVHVFSSLVQGGHQSSWTIDDEMSSDLESVLRRLDVPDGNLCTTFAIAFSDSSRPIAQFGSLGGEDLAFAVPFDDERIFFGTSKGRFFDIGLNGRETELTELSTRTPHSAAFRAGDGELWLVGELGKIARGHPDTGFTLIDVQTSTRAWRRSALAGPGNAQGPFELFLVTDRGSFERFDGERWSLLAQSEEHVERPSVVWIGPGEALAVGAGTTRHHVTWFRDGRVEQRALSAELGEASLVAQIPAVGTVLGTSEGIAVLSEEGWTPIEGPRQEGVRTDRMVSVWPSRSGFQFAGGSHRLRAGQFHSLAGFCSLEVDVVGFPELVVPLTEESFLLVEHTWHEGWEFRLTVLESRNSEPICDVR